VLGEDRMSCPQHTAIPEREEDPISNPEELGFGDRTRRTDLLAAVPILGNGAPAAASNILNLPPGDFHHNVG
jgi:hypothetical protein